MAEYKLDWGVPGLYGWYASGDDSNPKNGSERMPMLAQNGGDYPLSNFGFGGSASNLNLDGAAFATDPTGTWGNRCGEGQPDLHVPLLKTLQPASL